MCEHTTTFVNIIDVFECVECGKQHNPFTGEWSDDVLRDVLDK